MLRTVLLLLLASPALAGPLKLRSRVEPFKGSGEWHEVSLERRFDPKKTALVICDMWDDHWCKSAAKRCDALAKKAAPVVERLRKSGATIVHCPSDCMAFYEDTPQRKATRKVPKIKPPVERKLPDPPLPIDDSDGGCDDAEAPAFRKAWTRQHEAIRIAEGDLVSDTGLEVYAHLRMRGIETLLVMGVHTNMCVLHRSFGIKQMTRWGVKCVLVRDLTDAMYNPKRKPMVAHDEGTRLVVEHIEKHWCPTVLSDDLGK
ncbi:MAG: cysteine hydrolase family protein [Gemmataceae bacterium]|nr:cysteine hydrolase family protein [Gemmataceae bacterium]